MRDATRSYTSRQTARVKAHCTHSDTYSFFNLLTSDALLDTVEQLLPPHRERLYPPTETLSMFLAQAMSADRSCQNIVNQAAVQRLAGGLPVGSTSTGAYCQARQRLPLDLVAGLTRHLGGLIDAQVPDTWRWQGRRVRIVDGTTLTLPDTPANQAAFPQQQGQKPGLGFPICRLVGITCLASGVLLDAAVGRYHGKGGDEQTLLRSVQDNFKSGDIVLGDAYFPTDFFIAAMQAKGVDILMEQNGSRRRSTDFRRGRRLGPRDHVIVIDKPKKRPVWMGEDEYSEAPGALELREFKVGGKTLVTTLQSTATAPKEALKALYQSRWQVELDLRHIKETMGLGMLSCKTPEMAKKEIWVSLLAYNLIRLMMAQSALLADITPRTISFKHCLQLWVLSVQQIDPGDGEQLIMLWLMMAQQRVGNRPHRVEPRAVKRRPKPYPLLTKSRAQACEEVRRIGHPRKLN
jgi:hypothetical protein